VSPASVDMMDQEMTRQQTFKRRVRDRMAKTGESYTTARRQLLASAGDLFDEPREDSSAPTTAAPPSAAQRARRQLLERRRAWVGEATGRQMDEWIRLLDQAGARDLTHNQIWRWLAEAGEVADGSLREAITITYEQEIGRREMGQSCEGDYPASVSRPLKATVDEVLQRWLELIGGTRSFNGAKLVAEPSVSATEKFRYWRAKLTDGTRVTVTIWRMPDGRASLGIQQRAFPDRASADASKAYWKQFLAPLTAGLDGAREVSKR
jgi:hypothetical protein